MKSDNEIFIEAVDEFLDVILQYIDPGDLDDDTVDANYEYIEDFLREYRHNKNAI